MDEQVPAANSNLYDMCAGSNHSTGPSKQGQSKILGPLETPYPWALRINDIQKQLPCFYNVLLPSHIRKLW